MAMWCNAALSWWFPIGRVGDARGCQTRPGRARAVVARVGVSGAEPRDISCLADDFRGGQGGAAAEPVRWGRTEGPAGELSVESMDLASQPVQRSVRVRASRATSP